MVKTSITIKVGIAEYLHTCCFVRFMKAVHTVEKTIS